MDDINTSSTFQMGLLRNMVILERCEKGMTDAFYSDQLLSELRDLLDLSAIDRLYVNSYF